MVEIVNSVSALIAERVKTCSKENARHDPFKVGLVIEGGGMRGVVSAGMVTALQSLNVLGAIDGIYSVSSGSCNAAYFISGQTPDGTTIYYENINNRRFVDLYRILKGKPPVDIPYLTYEVMRKIKPLKWELIKESKIPLHVYVTSAQEPKIVDLVRFSTRDEVLDALHWTSRMPIYAGMPLKISEGRYYTDGTVLTGGIAIREAVGDGCTHILALLTRTEGTLGKSRSLFEKIMSHVLLRKFPELVAALDKEPKIYAENLSMIRFSENNSPTSQTKIEAVCVQSGNISRLEKNRSTLVSGAISGYKAVADKFGRYGLIQDKEIYVKQ